MKLSAYLTANPYGICLLLLLISSLSFAQTAPRFQKYPIETTGCFAYFPSEPSEFTHTKSSDNSDVYVGSAMWEDHEFGLILVKFSPEASGETNKEALNDLTKSYLDFLQEQFGIKGSAGYGLGHIHSENEQAIGIIDYWEDTDGGEWEVKAWTDPNFMAVMFIAHEATVTKELNYNLREMFFSGFRFPEK